MQTMNESIIEGVDESNMNTHPDPHQQQNAASEQQHQGEKDLHVPEHSSVDEMQFLSELEKLRDNAARLNAGTGVRDSIVRAIKHIHDTSLGYPTQGSLKVKKWKDSGKVSTENILTAKRDHSMMSTAPVKTKHEKKSKVKKALAKKKTAMQKGTRVKVISTRFDGEIKGSYSHDKPTWLKGTIVDIIKGKYNVVWDIDNMMTSSSGHHLTICKKEDNKVTTETVMAMLEVGAELEYSNTDTKAA